MLRFLDVGHASVQPLGFGLELVEQPVERLVIETRDTCSAVEPPRRATRPGSSEHQATGGTPVGPGGILRVQPGSDAAMLVATHPRTHPGRGLKMSSTDEQVAVLGIGVMGHGMAISALPAGIPTVVWNRKNHVRS